MNGASNLHHLERSWGGQGKTGGAGKVGRILLLLP